jgi:hypothetical protein
VEERDWALDSQRIPAHVGNFEAWGIGESPDAAWEHSKACVKAVFLALFEEELQAEADAEHGFSLGDGLADDFIESGRFELGDGVGECADAGQHKAIGFANSIGIGRD